MNDKRLRIVACLGLAVGGVFGIAGTFAPNASLRGLAWGIDGNALVLASALLTIRFFRTGQDLVAAGSLVFAVGQGLVLSVAAMDLDAGAPTFGAGTNLWAVALVLASVPRAFPLPVRLLGFGAAILFAATAAQNLRWSQTPAHVPAAPLLRLSGLRSDIRWLDLGAPEGRCRWHG